MNNLIQTYKADTCVPLKIAWEHGEVALEALARLRYPGRAIPPGMLPGVNSIGYWDTQTPQSWGLGWHRNEGLELTFLETGSVAFAVEGQPDVYLHPNDLTITRPWQMHRVGNPTVGVGRLYWIILDVTVRQPHQAWHWPDWIILSQQDREELTTMLRQNEQPVWPTHREIGHYFQAIGKAVEEDKAGSSESRLAILINELLLALLHLLKQGNIALDETLTKSMRSAELFLAELPLHLDKDWTLQNMAAYCGLGTTRFVHYCKKITNRTPMQHLNHLRLQAAAEMLTQYPDMNIHHIAYDCGFTSSQYFATAFKKQYGSSPKSFKIMKSERML